MLYIKCPAFSKDYSGNLQKFVNRITILEKLLIVCINAFKLINTLFGLT